MLSVYVVAALLVVSAHGEECDVAVNENTYYICQKTGGIRDFLPADEFCQAKGGHLLTFPSEKEHNFVISHLNKTLGSNLKFYVGIYQAHNNDNPYNPETGDFYWINQNTTKITADSPTYWAPFDKYILDFENLPLTKRQYSNFLMDKEGYIYPAIRVKGSKLPLEYESPVIVCLKAGRVVNADTQKSTPQNVFDGTLELWAIITITAAGVLALILIGIGIGCFVSKKGKFQKVPQQEQTEYNA